VTRTAAWRGAGLAALVGLAACGDAPVTDEPQPVVDAGSPDAGAPDAGTDAGDPSTPDGGGGELPAATPFADRVVSFTPGAGAGFGQDAFPGVVLGPPKGGGAGSGSLDVLSLGNGGSIVLELTDLALVDGPGVDLLVFENAFGGFAETGVVAVSDDGTTWHEFPCAASDRAGGFPGCAGVRPVYANPDTGISATDPAVAGGDAFDLATLGVSRARFVRIRDSGANGYGGTSGGFDLDALAVVNGVDPRTR
jgi:hypothetical protein